MDLRWKGTRRPVEKGSGSGGHTTSDMEDIVSK